MKEERYQDRWRSLEPDRLERYKVLFEYRPAADPLIVDIERVERIVEQAHGAGTLLILNPQFMVTAKSSQGDRPA